MIRVKRLPTGYIPHYEIYSNDKLVCTTDDAELAHKIWQIQMGRLDPPND